MKTKTYELIDGGTLPATSPEAFVMTMRKSSKFGSDCTNEEFMKQFAERYKIQSGEDIKTDDPDTFLSELARVGFVKELG